MSETFGKTLVFETRFVSSLKTQTSSKAGTLLCKFRLRDLIRTTMLGLRLSLPTLSQTPGIPHNLIKMIDFQRKEIQLTPQTKSCRTAEQQPHSPSLSSSDCVGGDTLLPNFKIP